jgi:hypothetical protein
MDKIVSLAITDTTLDLSCTATNQTGSVLVVLVEIQMQTLFRIITMTPLLRGVQTHQSCVNRLTLKKAKVMQTFRIFARVRSKRSWSSSISMAVRWRRIVEIGRYRAVLWVGCVRLVSRDGIVRQFIMVFVCDVMTCNVNA